MKSKHLPWMGLWLGAWLCMPWAAGAQPLPTLRVAVQARAQVPDLVCAPVPERRRAQAPANADVPVPPDEAEVMAQLQQAQAPDALPMPERPTQRWLQAREAGPLRVGIWGDSHLAAGFFTAELGRQLQADADQVQPRWLPASMGRAGVRLPLRKTCVRGAWRYEPAHADPRWAAGAVPSLVSMSSAEPGAALAWDLRLHDARAQRQQLRLHYQQSETSVLLALRVDEGEAQTLTLPPGPAGPAVLELQGDAPLSLIRLELLQGPWRWHALEMPLWPGTRLQLDVFGYPGATVAGWKHVGSLAPAPHGPDGSDEYDLVALAFGTNEGNVQPFDAAAYAQTLRAAVTAWRARYPQAACLLIGPGDRGVLVKRAAKKSRKSGHGPKTPARKSGADLLQFTRVHTEINRLQQAVAQEHGCRFWSMLQAMGGAGGAYRWYARQPALMARDLIHFTVPGYQQLARQLATDMGWEPAMLAPSPSSAPVGRP